MCIKQTTRIPLQNLPIKINFILFYFSSELTWGKTTGRCQYLKFYWSSLWNCSNRHLWYHIGKTLPLSPKVEGLRQARIGGGGSGVKLTAILKYLNFSLCQGFIPSCIRVIEQNSIKGTKNFISQKMKIIPWCCDKTSQEDYMQLFTFSLN
jgi:hypothetical protein